MDALNYNQLAPTHPHINAEPTSPTLTLQKLCTQNKGELSLSLSLWLEPIHSLAPGSGDCSSCHIRQLVYELQKGQCLERADVTAHFLVTLLPINRPCSFLSLGPARSLSCTHMLNLPSPPTLCSARLPVEVLMPRRLSVGADVQDSVSWFGFSQITPPASCKQTAPWHVHSANEAF